MCVSEKRIINGEKLPGLICEQYGTQGETREYRFVYQATKSNTSASPTGTWAYWSEVVVAKRDM